MIAVNTVVAVFLSMFLWTQGEAKTVPERLKDGSVKLCESGTAYPLLAFCVVLTIERGSTGMKSASKEKK